MMRLIALLMTMLCASVAAAATNVIIVDAGDTQTGETLTRWLSMLPDTRVTRVDFPGLRAAPAQGARAPPRLDQAGLVGARR